jgi:hypothetical protein
LTAWGSINRNGVALMAAAGGWKRHALLNFNIKSHENGRFAQCFQTDHPPRDILDDIGWFGARAFTDAAGLNRREIDLAGDVRTLAEAVFYSGFLRRFL